MGQLGAAISVGVIIGPLVGRLLSTDSLSLPIFVGSGLAFLPLLLVIFLLPELKLSSAADTSPIIPAEAQTIVKAVIIGQAVLISSYRAKVKA